MFKVFGISNTGDFSVCGKNLDANLCLPNVTFESLEQKEKSFSEHAFALLTLSSLNDFSFSLIVGLIIPTLLCFAR